MDVSVVVTPFVRFGDILHQNAQGATPHMFIQPVDGFVAANGLRLHYRRWLPLAERPDLPPILLLHGLASATHIWNLVAPLLAERGYMVTALDQRGHGESDKPASGYEYETIIADDTGAIQALEIEKPVVVGHSWGASVALQYGATYPERVTSLVMVDGATNQLSQRPGWTREQALIDLAPPRFAGTARETFLSFFKKGPLGQQWSPELEESVLHIVQLRDDDTVAPRLDFENHLQIIAAMWDQPTMELYQRVRCPLKLIVAEQRPITEEQQLFFARRNGGIERIQSILPSVQVVRMADTIHDIPLQRPHELAEEIMSNATSQA
jgi:pimeloyl-ACP methyl ester carboxylesterase